MSLYKYFLKAKIKYKIKKFNIYSNIKLCLMVSFNEISDHRIGQSLISKQLVVIVKFVKGWFCLLCIGRILRSMSNVSE